MESSIDMNEIKNDADHIRCVKMLKSGYEIRIKGPNCADLDYYEFIVTYNDLMDENGDQKYIGLKLKNDHVQMPAELKCFSRNYRLDGVGIAVTVNWIMLCLYKEEKYRPEVERFQQQITSNDEPKKINNAGAIPKTNQYSRNTEKLVNNSCGSVRPISNDLINLSYNQPKFPYSIKTFSNRTYGVIKRECIAIDVAELDDGIGHPLKAGTLIQILPDSRPDLICYTYFKIWDFTNWMEKFKMTIYRCSKDDYIVVAMELWPYLVALKNDEGRIKFVENVYKGKFDISILEVGQEIRIRGPPGADVMYYVFVVTYNGIMKEKGLGYYIALQLKNEQVLLTKDLIYLPQIYRSGKTTIVVPADWIMWNLYEEDECQTIPSANIAQEMENVSESKRFLSILTVEPVKIRETAEITMPNNMIGIAEINKQYISESIQPPSKATDNPKKTSETGTISNLRRLSNEIKYDSNYATEIELLNNANGSVKNTEETKCDLCAKIVKIGRGIILRECLHSFCLQCICDHVEQNSNAWRIQCPYFKEYDCKSDLWDIEIKDLGGELVFNKILDNRLQEFMTTESNSKKCANENCKNSFISPHKTDLNYEKCPECINKIYINNMKVVILDKCITCSKKPDVHLTRCGHPFCQKCIRQSMVNQVLEPSIKYINCIHCNEHITDRDISLYGSVEIFSLFKSKIDGATVITNPLEYISIEDWPVKCVLCGKQILVISCVILAGCRDIFCQWCFKVFIGRQLRNSQILECPKCSKCLEQFEVDAIMEIPLISSQMDHNQSPFGPLCQTLLDESQIARIRNKVRSEELTNQIQLGSVVVPDTDNCPVCIKQFEQRIDLIKCGHRFCHSCIENNIRVQQTKGIVPSCPVCRKPIKSDEVATIMKFPSHSNSDSF